PTAWVLPEISRFVPADDQARLRSEVGAKAMFVLPDVSHSVHRDAPEAFVDIVTQLSEGAGPRCPTRVFLPCFSPARGSRKFARDSGSRCACSPRIAFPVS